MSETPEDLKRRTSGHGFRYGCECDLQGGDPLCKTQPPYETIEAYCIRLLEYIFVLGQERGALQIAVRNLSESHDKLEAENSGLCNEAKDYENVCDMQREHIAELKREIEIQGMAIYERNEEVNTLRKQVERLSAPVEAIDFAGHLHPGSNSLPEIMNKINAARLEGSRT